MLGTQPFVIQHFHTESIYLIARYNRVAKYSVISPKNLREVVTYLCIAWMYNLFELLILYCLNIAHNCNSILDYDTMDFLPRLSKTWFVGVTNLPAAPSHTLTWNYHHGQSRQKPLSVKVFYLPLS